MSEPHTDPSVQQQLKTAFDKGGIAACNEILWKKADEWKSTRLNIGVLGNSGTGKSSFINTIRGLTAEDEGAAEVGVTETTKKPTPYSHPRNALLKFWDLPGVGTPKFPREAYLEKIGFDKFDFFLIMSKDRFTENDLWIAEAIAQKRKKFFFIRTNIHTNIANDKRTRPSKHDPKGVLETIRNDIEDNLGKIYQENEIFLIDNFKRNLYDFKKLEQALVENLPSLKRAAFLLSVNASSEEMVRKKIEILKSKIWVTTALAAGAATLMVFPGQSIEVNLQLVLKANEFYFQQLGLDKKSLKWTAEILCCDVATLAEMVEEFKDEFLTEDGIKRLIQSMAWHSSGGMADTILRCIPFINSATAGSATYQILDHCLTKLETLALRVFRDAVKSSAKLIDNASSDSD